MLRPGPTDDFCLFRSPGEEQPKLVFGNAIDYSAETSPGFVIQSFREGTWMIQGEAVPTADLHFLDKIGATEIDFKGRFAGKADFEGMVSAAIREIENRKLQKVVISRAERVVLPKQFSLKIFYERLLAAYPAAFVYVMRLNGQVWIGASPELLLTQEGNRLKSISLAGTKGLGDEFSDKEKVEQQIVTDYILERLRQIDSKAKAEQPMVVRTGEINHLSTTITAELPMGKSFDDVLANLHPTPAVAGVPKDSAINSISSIEGYSRGLYTGYLGYRLAGSASFYVNLRCMRLLGKQAVLFAGAGIVSQSDPEAEWGETVNKMNALRKYIWEDQL